MSGKKEYDLNMRRLGTKSSRLAAAAKALHEGVKEEEKYAMMDRLMASIENSSKEELEARAERIEKSVEERKLQTKDQGRKYLDPETRSQWISEQEYAKRAKEMLEDRNNR